MGEREALSAAEAAGRGVRGGGCVRLVRDEAGGHVSGLGEKCARTFSIGSQIAKNRFRDPGHLLPVGIARSV